MALKFLNNGYFAGKVGIGTDSLSSKLTISGQQELLQLTRGGASDSKWFFATDSAKLYIGENTSYGTGVKMTLTDAGNVGIGATSPSSKLQVSGDAYVTEEFGQGVAIANKLQTYGAEFRSGGASAQIFFGRSSNNIGSGAIGADSSYVFRVWKPTDFSNPFVIEQGGNVGIGTTSPGAKLHVLSTSTTEPTARIQSNGYTFLAGGTNDPYHALILRGTPAAATTYAVTAGDQMSFLEYGGDFRFYEKNSLNSGTLNEISRIHKTNSFFLSNVGIGVTGPTAKLHVSGGTKLLGGSFVVSTDGVEGANAFSYKFRDAVGINNPNSVSAPAVAGYVMTVGRSTSGSVGGGIYVEGESRFVRGLAGAINFNAYDGTNNTGTPTYLLGTDASGNIVKTNTVPGSAAGPYLPLAGGTMTGNINLNDNVFIKFGNQPDFEIGHDASNSYINHTGVGNLIIQNTEDNADIIFKSDNGSGGVAEYFRLDGGSTMNVFSKPTWHGDGIKSFFGNSQDLQIYHDGTHSWISDQGAGNLTVLASAFVVNNASDTENMIIASSDGSVNLYYDGSQKFRTISAGVEVTGGWVTSGVSVAQANVEHTDNTKALFGNGNDLEIYHNGSDSYIKDNGDGNLLITSNGASVQINKGTTENMAEFIVDGAVKLYYDSAKKLETGIVSVGTATTNGGTLIDGWKTTTQANAINDTTIATTAYVNNKIALIPAGLVFQGTWNASTNTPTLTSGSGTTGNFYIVSVAGSTNLDGITDWKVGDWAVFIEQGASDQWEKVDNSSVLDGSGTGQSVTKWDGSGTSNTLTDGPITFSGNNSTFSGTITTGGDLTIGGTGGIFIPEYIYHTGDGNTYFGFPSNNDTIVFATNGSTALTLDGANNATFAGNVAVQQAGDVYLTLESTDASTAEEVAIKYSNQSTGSNYWWAGLNQSANYSLAYGTSYSGANVKMEISTAGNAIFAGDVTTGANITATGDTGNSTLTLQANTGNWVFTNVQSSRDLQISDSDGTGTVMTINTSGNVGIGTTAPQAALHVAGSFDTNSPTGNGVLMGFYSGTHGYMQLNGPSGGYIDFSTSGTDHKGRILYDNTGNYLRLDTNGSEKLRINSAGNVGIGTSIGINKLDVAGNINVMGGNGSYLTFNNGDANIVINNNGTGRDLSFKTYDGSSNAERMRIDKNGNVGIGTTSPTEKLEVKSGSIFVNGEDNGIIVDSVSKRVGLMKYAGHEGVIARASTNDFGIVRCHTADIFDGSSLTYDFYVSGTGNVGIGTTGPRGKLDIVGNTDNDADFLTIQDNDTSAGSHRPSIRFRSDTAQIGQIVALDNSMRFSVGTTETSLLEIASSGNVGIGTTSPQSKLQIQANQHAADPGGKDYTGSAINADGGDIATGKLFLQGYQKTANDLCGFNNEADRVVLYNYTDARYLQLWNHTGDTNIPSGNLGIGMTTNPNSRLDVRRAGSGVALELHQTSGSANDYVDLKMIAGNTNAGTFGTILRHKRNGSGGGDFSILTNPTLTGTPIERMRITSAGYVGINCTPSYKLQWSDGTRTGLLDTNIGAVVIGSVSNDALALYTNLTEKMRIRPSGTVGIGHSGYDSQMLTIAAGTLDGAIYATSTDANCFASFRDNSSTANIEYGAIGNNHVFRKDASEQMRITSTGNVGIGTTSPTGKLEIQRSQVTTQFDRDSFLRLHPTTTTNSGGFTNIFFGTSPVNNYGVAIGGLRAGTDGTPSFSVRMLNDSITGTEVLNINNAGSVKFNAYNGTNNTGSPTHILGTDANGLIVKSTAGSSIGPWLPLAAGSGDPLTGVLYAGQGVKFTGGTIAAATTVLHTNNVVYARGGSGGMFLQNADGSDGIFIANDHIRLETGSAERMRILSGGNVGIGTTSPGKKLDVVSTSGTSIVQSLRNPSTSWNQYALTRYGTEGADFRYMDFGYFRGNNNEATRGLVVKSQANATLVTFLDAGNVGIGTTNPQSTLHLGDNANSIGGTLRLDSFVANQFWKLEPGTNTLNIKDYDGTSLASFNGASNYVLFNGGNVGIGMTNPAVPLDVEGKIRSNDSNSGDYLEIFCDGSVSGDSYIENTNNNIQIKSAFATSFSTSGSVAMFINNSQNVGIGTTSPGTKLVIEGTNDAAGTGVVEIKTTGTNLKIGGNTTYSWIQSHASKPLYINQLGNNVILNSGGGNVGIGTTSPSAKLSVVGDINFGGGNNNGIIEVSGSGDLIFKYKGSDPALTLDGGAVKTIVHNRLDALNVVNINNPSNNESILNIRDDDSSSNGHIAFENSSEVTGIVSSGTDFINFRAGDGVAITDSPMLTLLNNRIGINTTSPNSNVALDVDGRVLIKDSNGVADFYLGNYATANHFRFHTNNANTYFDMNCGNIYWRDGASTRYTFFPSTANMTVNGTITQNSDARVKENVVEISDCISKVQAMKGVYYNRTDFNTEATKVGVIAQDVEAVLPELIIESPEDGLKSVAYSELTAVLINAIKEQQEIIEDLKTRITKLEN